MSKDLAACFGCFVNPSLLPPITPLSPIPSPSALAVGLTSDEKAVLISLAEAWRNFEKLPEMHPADKSEFCTAIHDAQKLIAVRVARRVDKDVWNCFG